MNTVNHLKAALLPLLLKQLVSDQTETKMCSTFTSDITKKKTEQSVPEGQSLNVPLNPPEKSDNRMCSEGSFESAEVDLFVNWSDFNRY